MSEEKTLIFDFDGTIADSGVKIYEILNDILPSFGVRKIEESEIERLRGFEVQKLIKEFDVPIFKLPLIYYKFEEEYQKNIINLKPIKGIPEVLEKLQGKSVNMHIASSNSKESIRAFLKKNKLEYFKLIKGSSGILGKKRILEKILNEEKIEPKYVIYIGDEIRDIESAKKAGIKSAAVTWGFNNEKSLKETLPDFLINEPEELLSII